ncbi:MAG: hypothetical protein FWB76_00925 [Oscillospiraceae bacterium]|nr:hypothetical protein [Oscillospiraceae bacterium]
MINAIDVLFGEEFTGIKGQAAVEKLLQEKQGHVKAAFYRADIGEIDLFWGDDKAGLKHIIQERNKRGTNGTKFIENLSDVVENGEAFPNKNPNRMNIAYRGKLAVVAFDVRGSEVTALLTAFLTKK